MESRMNPNKKRVHENSLANLKRGGSTGRKPIPPDIKSAFNDLVPDAVARLSDIVRNSTDDKLVMDAVKVVLDRVYGRPAQSLDIESNNNHKIEVTLTEQLKTWAV